MQEPQSCALQWPSTGYCAPSVGVGAYERHAFDELTSRKIADFLRIRYGGTDDAKRLLGPVPAIREAFIAIQAHSYQ